MLDDDIALQVKSGAGLGFDKEPVNGSGAHHRPTVAEIGTNKQCMKVLGEDAATLTGVGNGRPPDHGVLIPVPTKLERMANPVCDEDRQVVKRSRGAGDDIMDVSEVGFEGEDRVSILVEDDTELDVELNAEDVRMSSLDGTPNKVDADACDAPSVSTKVVPTEKYGPWMMASGRKAWKAPREKNMGELVEVVSPNTMVSNGKFDVLAQLEADADGGEERSNSPMLSTSDPVSNGRLLETDGKRRSVMLEEVSMVPSECLQGENRPLLQGPSLMDLGSSVHAHESVEASKVASSRMVVPVPVTLDPKSHVAVRVVETGKDLAPLPRPGRRAYTDAGLAQMKPAIRLPHAKGGEKKGDSGRLKAIGRGSSKVRLGEWIGGLDAALVVDGPAKTNSTTDGLHKEGEVTVQWHHNTAFSTKSSN
ncbi:hypothetical protein V6N11_023448 [Hibiscus sabdariffa]|uniref:Uncharacterized protein n=1 Tax=Hibiscus sabdariffa TaxID=183260 RepID=A0ABR2TMT1_9ROSI